MFDRDFNFAGSVLIEDGNPNLRFLAGSFCPQAVEPTVLHAEVLGLLGELAGELAGVPVCTAQGRHRRNESDQPPTLRQAP